MDFGQVVLIAFDVQRRTQIGGTVGPGQAGTLGHHATFVPDTALAHQQLHRHGVQHFVADHHAFDGLGPGIQPAHLVGMCGQGLRLARAQRTRQIDDGVTPHFVAQRIEQLQGQGPRARPELEHLGGRGLFQGLAHLHGQGLAKQRCQARGRHKIAATVRHGAKLLQRAGVVPQSGLVQGQGHETVKREPATSFGNGLMHPPDQGAR